MLCQLNKKVMMKQKVEKSFDEMGLFFKGWKQLIEKQNFLVKKNSFEPFFASKNGIY